MNLVAHKLLSLEPNVDYTPTWNPTSPQVKTDPNRNYGGRYSQMPVFKVLVTSNNNTGTIDVKAFGNDDAVEIDARALKVGETYDIYLSSYELKGGANIGLVGFLSKNMPYEI